MKFSEISGNIFKSNVIITSLLIIGGVLEYLGKFSILCGFTSSVYYIFLSVVFVVFLIRHIVVRKQRICAVMAAIMIVLMFFLRMLKFKLLPEWSDVTRYIWYAYYIPLICIPLFFFYSSLMIGDKKTKSLKIVFILSGIISLLFIFSVITNDFHNLVFKFNDISDWNNYERSYLYLAICIWILFLFFSAYIILIRNCEILMGRKYSWLVIFYGLIGWGVTAFLALTDFQIKVFGSNIFEFWELYATQSISFVLTCIRLWLIPADNDYNRLNDAIAEVNDELKEESELSRLQLELKKEQLETEQKNQLYDEIAENIAHESEQILKLTQNNDNLPVVCVYGAYIKRLANLMLMASDYEYIPINEFVLAIREIAKYIGKTNVFISLHGNTEGEIRVFDAIDILRILNCIICDNLSDLIGIVVTFSQNNSSFLRVAVEGTDFSGVVSDVGENIVCSTFTEENITYITFGFVNGGDTL